MRVCVCVCVSVVLLQGKGKGRTERSVSCGGFPHHCPSAPLFHPSWPPLPSHPPYSSPAPGQITTRHFGTLRRFSVDELSKATNSFDEDNLLGEGGFSKVYKGRLEEGKAVAVKRIKVRQQHVAFRRGSGKEVAGEKADTRWLGEDKAAAMRATTVRE